MRNHAVFYFLVILIFGAALWFVLHQGKHLEAGKTPQPSFVEAPASTSQPAYFFSNVEKNSQHPLAILILQIFCIMIVAKVLGYLMTKIGQPSVIGEIVAGIVLGPSLVGFLFPSFSAFLFPPESLAKLHVLSQIGLVLFMFIIGMELNAGVLKKKAQAAVIISHASIIFPYFLGVSLAYFLYPLYAPEKISFSAFALFMGIAMSITAFPVLARIIQERDLTHTSIGTVVITCAAADDITAWCLLALVVAIVSAGGVLCVVGSITLSIIYVLFMWFILRPLLDRLAIKYDTPESVNKAVVAVVFGILFLSSYLTEIIGIHALFGAFLAGAIMPPQKEFKRILSEKIEDVSLVLLLPLFFVFTGLRTQIGLLNQAHLWGVCLLIIGVAVLGKFIGSAVAARFVGQSWKDSLLIGVLMNTRGLMELVVLNIGYDLGILSAEIFTMMVLMALVTTFMAGPVIMAIEFFFKSKEADKEIKEGFNALLSFGSPQSGGRLLELAYYLNLKNENDATITAVHFSPSADVSIPQAQQHEKEAFMPILQVAGRLNIPLKRIFGVTDNVEREVVEKVREKSYDIVLVGSSRELFTNDKTGGKVRNFVYQIESAVGIFIEGGFKKIDRAAIVLSGVPDIFLLKYAKMFLEHNKKNHLTVVDQHNILSSKEDLQRRLGSGGGERSVLKKLPEKEKKFYKEYDIVIVSFNFWKNLKSQQRSWLQEMPSVLIINE